MARIAGVDLPKNKRIEIGLTYIFGIGRSTSKRILTKLKIDPDLQTDRLSESEVSSIRKVIDNEYKAPHGSGELPRIASPQVTPGSWAEDQHQCPHS